MGNLTNLSQKLCRLHCFLNNINWDEIIENNRYIEIETVVMQNPNWDYNLLFSIINKIESETNETVKIDGEVIEIYGSIHPSIIVEHLELSKKELLIEALFRYVDKRY